MPPFRTLTLATLSSILFASPAMSGVTDIEFQPTTSAGHDFNHAPIGQTFVALASQTKAGLYIADQNSFTNWLSTVYPGQIQPGSYPYAIAPSIQLNIQLSEGEGLTGPVLDSRNMTLTAPYMGFIDIDYAALGINLTVGQSYTLLVTDVSNLAYPNGVTGWVVPAVHDNSIQPTGAYLDGHPILQGSLVLNETGIGDNAFHVVDVTSSGYPPPQSSTCEGANKVITSVGRNFIVVNGGMNLADHVWYAPQSGTTFLGGTTTFVNGERVTYSGTLNPVAGCYADTMTVMPPPTVVVISGTLPNGQVGANYSASLSVSGGVVPYTWSANGLPPGITQLAGTFSGIPSVAGIYPMTVNIEDVSGSSSSSSYELTISPAAIETNPCKKPKSAKNSKGKGKVTEIGIDYIKVNKLRIDFKTCSSVHYGGDADMPNVSDKVEWQGFIEPNGNIMGQTLSFN